MGISITAYAKSRKSRGLPGGSRYGVQKAIHDGRIVKEPDGTVDPEKADRMWDDNTSEAKRHVDPRPSTYQEARAVREALVARLTKIELDQKVGELVRADDVKKEAFRRWRATRDRFLAIPGRVGPALVAARTAKEIEVILSKAVKEALGDLGEE